MNQIFLRDSAWKNDTLEVFGDADDVTFSAVVGHNFTDIRLDEGSVDELYEFLGRWLDEHNS